MDNNSKKIGSPPPGKESSVNEAGDEFKDVIHTEKYTSALGKSTEMIKDLSLMDNEAVSKTIRKEKPPTLAPESIRALLENFFQITWLKKEHSPKFLTYLGVSKIFLDVSRRYPIFCLAVGYRLRDTILTCTDLSVFKPPKIKGMLDFTNHAVMSYQKMQSVLLMLKPNHLFMIFERSDLPSGLIRKCADQLDLAPGKVALEIHDKFKSSFSLLLNRFSRRKLDFLMCELDFLIRSDVTLEIGHFNMPYMINKIQLSKVLSHNLDSLEINIDEDFIAEPNPDKIAPLQSSKPDVCGSLKHLNVCCRRSYDSFMELLDMVKGRCLKLETLHTDILFSQEVASDFVVVSDADEIMDHILAANGKIQEIVEKCRPFVSNLQIDSIVSLIYRPNREFSCDWIGRAKTMDLFKDAIHEETFDLLLNLPSNVCKLTSKFYNGFLEMAHKTKVYRFIRQ